MSALSLPEITIVLTLTKLLNEPYMPHCTCSLEVATTWLPWSSILFFKHMVFDGHSFFCHSLQCFVAYIFAQTTHGKHIGNGRQMCWKTRYTEWNKLLKNLIFLWKIIVLSSHGVKLKRLKKKKSYIQGFKAVISITKLLPSNCHLVK